MENICVVDFGCRRIRNMEYECR